MSVVVFLSAVSSEFQHHDPKRPLDFQPYRDVLAKALRRMGSNYAVVVQEDLAQGFGDLLETLDEEVSRSSLVVHLVGNVAGAIPEQAEVRQLFSRHQNFLDNQPELSAALDGASEVSYTQWEVYLAFHHGRHRLVFVANANAPRSPNCKTLDIEASQARHLDRLEATGKHREDFQDQRDLAMKVVTSVARYGLGVEETGQRPTSEAVEAARKDATGLANEIAEKIRKPDTKHAWEMDDTGIDRFLRAVDTAALQRELDRRSALEIVHQHRETLLDAVAYETTDANIEALAFAELALGHYFNSMHAARHCAELAEQQMAADSDHAEEHREIALNAYLLLHDAATAVNRRSDAIAALERGCELIDRTSDPILWANYNEQLAKYLLDQAQIDRAEELIDEITDIREDLQPDTEALAGSLLLWCRLLHVLADFQGLIDVSKRAKQIFAAQTPPIMTGISAALNARALALQATNRLAEAEPLVRRALAIDEQSYGAEHPNVGRDLNNLAQLLKATNRLAESEPLMRRALAIGEQSYGAEHPEVARDLNNLAQLLQATNRLAEAEPLMRRAVEIFRASLGKDHPNTQAVEGNLERLLKETDG